MSNTHGLDALAALCGSTAAASGEGAANAAALAPGSNQINVNCNGANAAASSAPNQLAATSLYAQQMQRQAQWQQVQQVLAMRQAEQAAAAQAAQAQQQQTPSPAPALSSHQQQLLHAQLMLQAAQQQQQQQQQQAQAQHNNQQVNALGPAHALAAQLLAAQQQAQAQQQHNAIGATAAAASHPNFAAFSRLGSPGVLPGIVPSPALAVSSPPAQAGYETQASPSSLAMPPPPKVAPALALAVPPKGGKKGAKIKSGGSKSSKQPPLSLTTAAQPPIQDIISEWEDKKQAKRAANRLSAHLSRKRKKMFIEDLKDENVELRRKEQILRSIPDLIVVFDSSGCISFVSHAITRFLEYTVEEIENTSFWDLLTQESVRSIKSSFMDALAVKRSPEEDSTPLANGDSMSVKMLCKDANGGDEDDGVLVSLKGVVHFAGESPECVCSIRLNEDVSVTSSSSAPSDKNKKAAKMKESASPSAAGQGARQEKVPSPPGNQISDIESEQKSEQSFGDIESEQS